MPTSEPLHVAFVWHMHQPYYRSALTGAFEMPWARMHALKDYLDMVETLAAYPDLHQTFNLVPSLVEQLETYASGEFVDVYWEHTLKPAVDLDLAERTFVVERMCERSDHPRPRSHPRYLELARKREAQAFQGWEACACAFAVDELRDLQVWFNLAWFDPQTLEAEPLADLVRRGRDFREEDKEALAHVQADILARTLAAYRGAADRGQVELSTSPYFHPILPLLVNSDSARIAAADTLLPPRRFAHPEDAVDQIERALVKHERVFGKPPRGMWCSEQAVGEDVIPLLIDAGVTWTISDETVLARSLSGAAAPRVATADAEVGTASGSLSPRALYAPYRLQRQGGEIAIVFRDHTLSDLIGFAYQSWDSREAAADLLRRLREIGATVFSSPSVAPGGGGAPLSATGRADIPLVTIALDGENAWEYYPRDGRDFLRYLYEGLSADPALQCVTISEHLRDSPPVRSLGWLHTGSWIGGDLRTWSGDRAHNAAWNMLHQARDLAASRREPTSRVTTLGSPAGSSMTFGSPAGSSMGDNPTGNDRGETPSEDDDALSAAWRHILIAEGSDWFWWFGDHHHTELDHVWDLNFRRHLQEVFRSLGEPVPMELFLPLLEGGAATLPTLPRGPVAPTIDGLLGVGLDDPASEWGAAGILVPDLSSTMQLAQGTKIREARFGWHGERLCLLVVPERSSLLLGLEMELRIRGIIGEEGLAVRLALEENGHVGVSCTGCPGVLAAAEAAWGDVIEVSLPMDASTIADGGPMGLVLRIGREGMTEHVFHTAGLASLGWGGK
jgi:alpha-amylase/alpha-mannosidase (GH57 family)